MAKASKTFFLQSSKMHLKPSGENFNYMNLKGLSWLN
jgi:hypothetical protein